MAKKRSDSLVRSLLYGGNPISDEVCAQLMSIRGESRVLDFKREFDPASNGDWCELVKDLVAMANTDGGYIIVGATDNGTSSGRDISVASTIDQAVIVDKIGKYTEVQPQEVNIRHWTDGQRERVIFHVGTSDIPIVFCKPGTYVVSDNKQKTAFSAGTIYFRHGSKSESARQADLQRAFDSFFARRRREILSGIQKVIKTRPDQQVVVLPKSIRLSQDPSALGVRLTDDPKATLVRGIIGSGKYSSEAEELATVVRNLETDPLAYAAEAQLWRFYACRKQLGDGEEALRCLLISSMYRHCPPYYWACQLGPRLVAQVCLNEANKDAYPGIQVAVRLAFAIGGVTGRKILEQIIAHSKYAYASKLARRLLGDTVLPWRVWKNYGCRAITIRTDAGTRQHEVSKDDLNQAEAMIDGVLTKKINRNVVKKLDALVYGTRLERQGVGNK